MTAIAPIPVDDGSLRDPKEPRRHRTAASIKASPGSPGPSKDFAREVLCLVSVLNAGANVPPDRQKLLAVNVREVRTVPVAGDGHPSPPLIWAPQVYFANRWERSQPGHGRPSWRRGPALQEVREAGPDGATGTSSNSDCGRSAISRAMGFAETLWLRIDARGQACPSAEAGDHASMQRTAFG